MPLRFKTLLLSITVLVLALPGAAQARTVAGAADDRAGRVDSPQQDIRSAAVVYDTTGLLRGTIVVAEPPTSAGVTGIGVSLGVWSKRRGWCSSNADVDVRPPTANDPDWFGSLFIDDDEDGLPANVSPQGASTVFEVATTRAARQSWNCAWAESFGPANDPKTDDYKVNDESDVFSLTAEQAKNPRAKPNCAIAKRRVRRGGTVRLRCSNVRGRVTVRIYRDNKLKKTVRLRGGKVSTRGLGKGSWDFLAWRGSDVVGDSVVKIR